MLITNLHRRDAGFYYKTEADAGGGSASDDSSKDDSNAGADEMTAAEIKAELERTRAALKAANKEAGDRRKKLDEIEAANAKRAESELSEAQKAAKRAEDAEKAYRALQATTRQAAIRGAIMLAAARAEFVDAEDAFKLADLTSVAVGDDLTVTGAEDAVKALAKAKPHLLKQATSNSGGDINARDRGRAGAPSQEQIVEQKRRTGQYAPV